MTREEWLKIKIMTREQFDALPDWGSNHPQIENTIYKMPDGISCHRHRKYEHDTNLTITMFNEMKKLEGAK